MYTSFYNLKTKPFQISSDPAFMWFGEKHREALATLKYGILDNKGFLLLTGDVGTGKTTLINTLIQSLSDDIICAMVPDPSLEKIDFFNFIAAEFGIDREFSTKGAFLAYFKKFLIQASENNKKVLLIIDEAQLLTQEMLEEVRLLSNIEKADAKLINIFFVGQNEFNQILNQEKNRAVRQRLTLNYNVDPLTPDETAEYIKHRLDVAKAEYTIFDTSAVQEIFLYSGGFPRRINIICDHCLLSGYVKEQKKINSAIVRECAKELKIPAHIKNRDINGFAGPRHTSASGSRSRPLKIPEQVEQKTKNKKTGRKFFLKGVAFILFCVLVWFFAFPETHGDSMAFINRNLTRLQHKLIQLEPYFSFSNQKPKHISQTDNDEIKTRAEQNKENIEERLVEERLVEEKTEPSGQPVETLSENSVEEIVEDSVDKIKAGGTGEEVPVKDPVETQTADSIAVGEIPQVLDPQILDPEPLPLPREKVIVRFKYNTNDFTQEGLEKLVRLSDILASYPEAHIVISGYTDSAGYEKYNRKLSEFRANIVKSFFLGRGITPDNIQVHGLGSQNPIESNETAWGRMMNRRVEIEIKNNIAKNLLHHE